MGNKLRTDAIQGDIVHEYDGIEEADNRLPTWWLWTFYGAIAFSVFYWFYYHEFGVGKQPLEEYTAQRIAQANSGKGVTKELLASLVHDKDAVNAGRAVFSTQCVACHEQNGQGKIGPNLTDAYWIHGGSSIDIYKVVDEGVAAKGMPAWGAVLGSTSVQQVTAYLLSIRDTNVSGKEPQGERWSEEAQPVGPRTDASAAQEGATQ